MRHRGAPEGHRRGRAGLDRASARPKLRPTAEFRDGPCHDTACALANPKRIDPARAIPCGTGSRRGEQEGRGAPSHSRVCDPSCANRGGAGSSRASPRGCRSSKVSSSAVNRMPPASSTRTRSVVGAAAELSGSGDEDQGRHPIAVEQPVEDRGLGQRIASGSAGFSARRTNTAAATPSARRLQHRQANAPVDPAQRRQMQGQRDRQPGVFETDRRRQDRAPSTPTA